MVPDAHARNGWIPGGTQQGHCARWQGCAVRPGLFPAESSVGQGVVARGGRLQFSHLQPEQGGTYTCVAENAQAEARKDFVVVVLGK